MNDFYIYRDILSNIKEQNKYALDIKTFEGMEVDILKLFISRIRLIKMVHIDIDYFNPVLVARIFFTYLVARCTYVTHFKMLFL